MGSTYTKKKISRFDMPEFWACEFCGAVVYETYWDDHVSWHETLDMQATMLLQTRLAEMEATLHEQSLREAMSSVSDRSDPVPMPIEGQECDLGEIK